MINFPKYDRYAFTGLERCIDPPVYFTFEFLYGNLNSNSSHLKTEVIGWSINIIGCNEDLLHHEQYLANDASETFVKFILTNTEYYIDEIVNNQLPLETSEEERAFAKSLTHCSFCNEAFTETNYVVIDHLHHRPSSERNVVKNNCPCRKCNLLKYPHRRIIAFYYNLSIAAPHILQFLRDSPSTHFISAIPSSSGGGFISLKIGKLQIYDADSHFMRPLHTVMQTFPAETFNLLKNVVSNETAFTAMIRGLAFPCSHVSDVENLKMKSMYDIPVFTDIHNLLLQDNSHETSYRDKLTVYLIVKTCMNMQSSYY